MNFQERQDNQAGKKPTSPNPTDPFAFAPDRVAEAHYVDFLAITAVAITEKNITDEEFSEKVGINDSLLDLLLKAFRMVTPKEPAKLAPEYIRLLIVGKTQKLRIVVDQNGIFKMNDAPPYQMNCLSYLLLSRIMEKAADASAKRRGIKRAK
jgi:hypothetical protein